MNCKNNPTIECNDQECKDCQYQKGISEAIELKGFDFMTEDGNFITGIQAIETDKKD
jgi:hypothetical protein